MSPADLLDLLGPRIAQARMNAGPPVVLDNRLRIERPLAHGARGLVCQAYDLRLKRPVAVKLYPLGPDVTHEVEAEAQTLGQLRHDNIVDVFDVGHAAIDVDGTRIECLTLTMEYIEGTTLRIWLRSPRSRAEILRTFLAAGAGLAAAHAKQIHHRDFKPENVMIGSDGVARVVDFGLARAPQIADEASAVPHRTRFGPFAGTPEYMAPEARQGRTGERSDQYAFAVALWNALTGVYPYDAERGEWRLAHDADFFGAAKLPRRLAKPLRRALEHAPEDRHPSMTSLLTQLNSAATPRLQLAVVAALVVMLGLAYTWRSAAPEAAPTLAPPTPPASTPAAPPSAFVREAWMAYLATMRAYNRRDAEAYFGGFMAPMECFYSLRNADIRKRRDKLVGYLEISERDLSLVDTDEATRVTFCDRGIFDYEHGKGRIAHSKAIVMRKVGGAWKIAVETTSKHRTCFASPCSPPSL